MVSESQQSLGFKHLKMSSVGKGTLMSALVGLLMACLIVGAEQTVETGERKDVVPRLHEIVISSCDDLAIYTDMENYAVRVAGDIICEERKNIHLTKGARASFYSFDHIHMEGVRFLVESGATVFFGAPTVALDKWKGSDEAVFTVAGNLEFFVDTWTTQHALVTTEDLHEVMRMVGDGAIESDGEVHYTETGIVVAKPMQQGQADDPWAEELDAFLQECEPSTMEYPASSAESPPPKGVDAMLDNNHGNYISENKITEPADVDSVPNGVIDNLHEVNDDSTKYDVVHEGLPPQAMDDVKTEQPSDSTPSSNSRPLSDDTGEVGSVKNEARFQQRRGSLEQPRNDDNNNNNNKNSPSHTSYEHVKFVPPMPYQIYGKGYTRPAQRIPHKSCWAHSCPRGDSSPEQTTLDQLITRASRHRMSVKVGEPLKWPGFLTSDTGSKLGLGTEGTIRMEMPNTHGGETGGNGDAHVEIVARPEVSEVKQARSKRSKRGNSAGRVGGDIRHPTLRVTDAGNVEVSVDGVTVMALSDPKTKPKKGWMKNPFRRRKREASADYELHVVSDGFEVRLDGVTAWEMHAGAPL